MPTKCIVKGCNNRPHEGTFVGCLCSPCYTMLRTGNVSFGGTFIHDIEHERQQLQADLGSVVALTGMLKEKYIG